MKNKLKEMRGITLIALVITIIVLLILAGVSIATLTGENGLLTQAQSTKTANKKGEAEEIFKLISNEWQIEKRKTTGARDLKTFLGDKAKEYDNKLVVSGDSAPYTLTYNGEEIQINNDGSLTEVPKPLEAGLYDENDNLLISWADLTSMEYQTVTAKIEDGDGGVITKTGAILNVENGVLSTITGNDINTGNFKNFSGDYLNGKLVISDSVTSIQGSAFSYCESLRTVVMPNSITSIGNSAFEESRVSSVVFSNNIETISPYSFLHTSLQSVEIPEGVTTIGDGAFSTTPMDSVTLPSTLTKIGSGAFEMSSLTTINFNGKTEDWNNITLTSDWNMDCSKIIVHCTDDDIEIPAYGE